MEKEARQQGFVNGVERGAEALVTVCVSVISEGEHSREDDWRFEFGGERTIVVVRRTNGARRNS